MKQSQLSSQNLNKFNKLPERKATIDNILTSMSPLRPQKKPALEFGRPRKLDSESLNDLLKTKLMKAPGEIHRFVIQICQAKRIDPNLLLDSKLNKLAAEVEAAKAQQNPQNLARCKAKHDIFIKKRLAALQVIKDTIEQRKQIVTEMIGTQPYDAKWPSRKSLNYLQNPGLMHEYQIQQLMNDGQSYSYNRMSTTGGTGEAATAAPDKLQNASILAKKPTRNATIGKSNLRERPEGQSHLEPLPISNKIKQQSTDFSPAPESPSFMMEMKKRKSRIAGFVGSSQNTNEVFANTQVHLENGMRTPNRFQIRPLDGKGRYSRSQFMQWGTAKLPRLKKDPADLPHNRLPDIEPRISIGSYMSQKWTGQRNLSAQRQGHFIRNRNILASKTIEALELKMKKKEAQAKAQAKQQKDAQEVLEYNAAQAKEKRQLVTTKNKENGQNWMARSMSNYRDHLRKTATSIEVKRRNEMARSQSHFEQIRASSALREQQKIEIKRFEENRIRPALSLASKSVIEHHQRAQSARDTRVNRLQEKNSDWESACEEQRQRVLDNEFKAMQKSINKREQTEKKIRNRDSTTKFESQERHENYLARRANFDSVSERNRDQRNKDIRKINQYHKRIDEQVSSRNDRMYEKQVYQTELNESRAEERNKNNKQNQNQLDCIKERVRRKYVRTQRRRQLQLQDMAPPTTYDIYMQSQSVRPSTQGASVNPYSQLPPTMRHSVVGTTTAASTRKSNVELNPAQLQNPHLDFSLRFAMMQTFDGTNVNKKKPKTAGEPS